MAHRHLTIVVGEGASMRNGLLRFVLEGEGFEVAAEAGTVAQLSQALTTHQPDVVILDDNFGTAGLELSKQAAPGAKIVLIWPAAVQPIGADARVDPSRVLRELGPTVQRVTGVTPFSAMTETFDRPDWIGRVRKDPAVLREILSAGPAPTAGPSVTELQEASRGLNASGKEAIDAVAPEAIEPAVAAAPQNAEPTEPPISIEPEVVEPAVAALALVPAFADTPAEPATASPAAADVVPIASGRDQSRSEAWNRKLGTIALGAAAVAGAMVLSIALGSERVPVHVAGQAAPTGDAITIPGTSGTPSVAPPNHDGQGTHHQGASTTPGGGGGGTGTNGTRIGSTGGTGGRTGGGGGGGGTSGGGTSGGGTSGGGTSSGRGGGTSSGGGTGSGGGGGGGTVPPGHSGDHNPHGQPPGHDREHGRGNGRGGDSGGHGDARVNGHHSTKQGTRAHPHKS